MEDKPPMPEKGNSLPDPRGSCPECGLETPLRERELDSEQIGGYTRRIDYWCQRCDAHLGIRTSYEGPEPVRTHNGWELH